MKATNANSFTNDVINAKKIVLLDVWAPWCPPCRMMNPVVEEVSKEVADWGEVVKLDAEAEAGLAGSLNITSLPTFIIFKDGKVVDSFLGATSKANLIERMQKAR